MAKDAATKTTRQKSKIAHDEPTSPRTLKRKKLEEGVAKSVKISVKGKEKATDASGKGYVLPSTFKIVAGSYEKLLYGLEGTVTWVESVYTFHLKPIFIFPAHVSCIKAVAASPQGGKWLATGSADEIVKIWDLRRRKEVGGLMHHEGSITHLHFPSRSHLLSASEDGTLCLFRARDWSVLRSLKGHKGRVNSVAIHPSGKVALSVGKDRTLRMWDLMRGKGSASTKLGKEGEIVRWSTTGSHFIVQYQSTIELFSTDMVLQHTITHPSRIHDIKFCKRVTGVGELLLVAAEDKKVSIYDLRKDVKDSPIIIAEMTGHSNRVKAIDTLEIALSPQAERQRNARQSTTIVSTVSSDGKIYIYDLAALPINSSANDKYQMGPDSQYDTKGTRLTCVAIADGESIEESVAVNTKRKRSGDEEGSESDEGNEEDEWLQLQSDGADHESKNDGSEDE